MANNLVSKSRENPLSLAALICGVLGLVVFFLGGPALDLWPLGALIGLAAVVLGLMGRKRESAARGFATTGLVLGGIVVVWFVVFIILAWIGVVSDD